MIEGKREVGSEGERVEKGGGREGEGGRERGEK